MLTFSDGEHAGERRRESGAARIGEFALDGDK